MSTTKHRRDQKRIKGEVLAKSAGKQSTGVEKDLDVTQDKLITHGGSKSQIKQGMSPEDVNEVNLNSPHTQPKIRTKVSNKKLYAGKRGWHSKPPRDNR